MTELTCKACDQVIEPRLKDGKNVNLYIMRMEAYDDKFDLIQTDIHFHTECWQLGFAAAVIAGYKSLEDTTS